MKVVKNTNLKDKHRQLIDLLQDDNGKWYWRFTNDPDGTDPVGPFATDEAATIDAQEFCDETAEPGG